MQGHGAERAPHGHGEVWTQSGETYRVGKAHTLSSTPDGPLNPTRIPEHRGRNSPEDHWVWQNNNRRRKLDRARKEAQKRSEFSSGSVWSPILSQE